jgi:CRP/FNR family transcriptional regulator
MEGSGGAAFFLIDSGEATVTSKGVQVATLGPGDCCGELALIDGGPRSATVIAATDLVCYGLTFWEFRPLVERNGAIGWKLLQALAKRLRASHPDSPNQPGSVSASPSNSPAPGG